MLTDIIAERFLEKLGAESYNERISIVEKYKKQWELSEIDENIGKGVFTPNFESEFQMIRSSLLALL